MPAAITLDAVILSTSNTKWDQEISEKPEIGKMLVAQIWALSHLVLQPALTVDTKSNTLNVGSFFLLPCHFFHPDFSPFP
jgi:hypothetical protein